jgi:hypothetical protein
MPEEETYAMDIVEEKRRCLADGGTHRTRLSEPLTAAIDKPCCRFY